MGRIIFPLLFAALIIAFIAGIFASVLPDGLEKVAHNLGFAQKAKSSPGVFVDYNLPVISIPFSGILAGLFGILVVYFVIHSFIHLEHLKVIVAKVFRIDNWLDRKNKK